MHISFIMDGNRRWAKKHGLLKTLGHTSGEDTIEKVVEWCVERGDVEVVSAWGLAKKNVESRDRSELDHIYRLVRERLPRLERKLLDNGVSFHVIGDLSLVPTDVAELMRDMERRTEKETRMKFALAFAYGGRDEIVRATRSILDEIADAADPAEAAKTWRTKLDEISLRSRLDTARVGISEPDLIVRTGGDSRHSGFLLYDCEYSEYYYTPTLWPDFDQTELEKSIEYYRTCKRNFGK